MNLFKKRIPNKLKESDALKLLEANGYLSAALLQREFSVGYAQASIMLEALEKKGCIRYDGQRWVEVK